METSIISLETRKGVRPGDVIKVRKGFARHLFAHGKALIKNAENQEKFESMRAQLAKAETEALEKAQARAVQLQALTLRISSRAADEIRLYGSLGPRELAKAITEAGVPVEKREVRLAQGPIRTLGVHSIEVQLHTATVVTLEVNVVPETH